MKKFPAFPVVGAGLGHQGMTLRDYFAAQALQGWLASWPRIAEPVEDVLAHHCYLMADAMLKARETES